MSAKMQEVLEEALQLSPVEQLALSRRISESLQAQYKDNVGESSTGEDRIPSSVKRAKPITDLADYIADFWPDDESVDEFNAYVQEQRRLTAGQL